MAPQPSEGDIISNRQNVILAKSQRLIASWLPPPANDEPAKSKTEEEIEKEEQEMFTPVPELYVCDQESHLRAKIPEDVLDGDLKRQKLTSNDVLRKQLLGKDLARLQNKSGRGQGDPRGLEGTLPVGSKPRPAPAKRKEDDISSDDEGGRSGLGKKRPRKMEATEDGQGIEVNAQEDRKLAHIGSENGHHSKKPRSYLDEVLAQKQKKHKTKKKRKANQMGDATEEG
ncbi:MAG: hypothetical protein Q9218_002386 [Villophora microphyllina]